MESTKDLIEAEVVLRPRDSSVSETQPVRAESVGQFEANPETVEEIVRKLRELGFQVLAQSPTSISIAGTRALYDGVFKSKEGPDSMPAELIVPGDLENHVEGVYIQIPPTYH